MKWNISYDVCAIIILTIFCSYIFMMKRFKSKLNRHYDVLCLITLVSVIFDILGVITITYPKIFPWYIILAVNLTYLLIVNSLVVALYRYILVMTDSTHRGIIRQLLCCVPYLLTVILIVSTPFTKAIIYVEKDGTYLYGSHYVALHVLSGIYVILCIYTVIHYKKRVSTHRKIAIYLFLFFLLAAIGIQAVLTDLLLLGFACTIGAIALYLGQFNPNETIDDETDLFNKYAFYISLAGHIDDKNEFSIIAIELDDVEDISAKYGAGKLPLIRKKIAEYLLELVYAQAAYKLDENRYALLIGSKDKMVREETIRNFSYASEVFLGEGRINNSEENRSLIQALFERFDHTWHIGEDEVLLSVCMCYITYPEDVHRADEVNDMIDASLRHAREIGTGTVLYAAEYIRTRENYINELQKKQVELQEMTQKAEEAREAAERADTSKTRFLANMSHEIRTPMNAIMGMTELVLRDEINDQVRRNMNNIQSAGNTLLAIINDILDFSKIEAGKMEINEGVYDTSSLINNVLSVSAARLIGKNVDLIVDVTPNLPSQFFGDEMRLRQIIINLLGNAIKYTETGSVTLRMEWALDDNNEANGDTMSSLLTVSVIDTGSGIREEDLKKLFTSFTRIDEKKNRLIEGTGLGLSICKRLLDLMGGSITVKSVYGKGSIFEFSLSQDIVNIRPFTYVEDAESLNTLLYAESKEIQTGLTAVLAQLNVPCVVVDTEKELEVVLTAHEFTHIFLEYSQYENIRSKLQIIGKTKLIFALKGRQLLASRINAVTVQQPFYCLNVADALNDTFTNVIGQKKNSANYLAPEARILAIDDNIVNLQILSGLLQPHKMQIDTAESGKEGLQLLRTSQYDMVLLDHMMPEMDGIETLQEIRLLEGEYYKTVPVIAVTANAISGVREMFEEAGFQDYISKPINIERMEETIIKYLPLEKIQYGELVSSSEPGRVVNMFIQGVNIQDGIEQCGGRFLNYLSLLDIVLKDGHNKLHLLETYYTKEDYKNYMIEAHALKSVAASIGAKALSQMAKEQEAACKEEKYDEVKENHRKMYDSYALLLEHIENVLKDNQDLLQTEKAQNSYEMSEDIFRDRLYGLLALLHDFEEEVGMRQVKEILSAALTEEQRTIMKELLHHFELFDYEDAEEYIKKLL